MGTCNFSKRFAADYYVVDGRRYFNSDGEEIEKWEEGCEVFDDTDYVLDDIVEVAKSCGWESGDRDCLCKKWEDEDLVLGTTPFEILTKVEFLPGYYEAGNLDWDIRVRIPGSWFDVNLSDFYTIEDFADDVSYAFMDYEDGWNEGLKKMQLKNIVKKMLDKIREVGLKADEFCKSVCTGVYAVSARFSNGETWYTKIG